MPETLPEKLRRLADEAEDDNLPCDCGRVTTWADHKKGCAVFAWQAQKYSARRSLRDAALVLARQLADVYEALKARTHPESDLCVGPGCQQAHRALAATDAALGPLLEK